MKRTLFTFLNLVVAIMSIAAFYSCYFSPSEYWYSGFLGFTVPVFLLANMFFILVWLFKQWRKALISLIVLISGWHHIKASIAWNTSSDRQGLSVTSYNVRVFNSYSYLGDKENLGSKKELEWLATNGSDILCLQEFYNQDTSAVFNAIKKLKNAGYEAFHSPSLTDASGATFGMAIFSKYPILDTGSIAFASNKFNKVIYADIAYEQDTLRVYDVHLQSTFIEEKDVFDLKELKEVQNENGLISKLRVGFKNRAIQVEELAAVIKKSKKPVIVCGDFNDTPYSYTYHTLKSELKNSFEEAGNGLGFTYNGKIFFLRIDHQWASNEFDIQSFQVNRDISWSDHFPITATYKFLK